MSSDDEILKDWMDGQEVMELLHISARTLQTLRSNGTLPFSPIGNKLFYRRQDIVALLSDNYTMYKIRGYGKSAAVAPHFSFFKAPITNVKPHKAVTLLQVYNAIKGDYFKERTIQLRAIADVGQARKFKASHFAYCTFSGLFTARNDKALVKHSGLLCLDFDHLPDLVDLKGRLLEDEYFETQLLFTSPSGNGLKWVIPIDIKSISHGDYFTAVANYVLQTYGVAVDKSGRDVSRACFLGYDPEAFLVER